MLCQYLEFLNYLFTRGNAVFSYTERDFGIGFAYAPYLIVENINKLPINCLRVLDISNPLEYYIDYYWFDADGKKHKMDVRLSSFPNRINKMMIKLRKEYNVPPSLDNFKREVTKILFHK